MRLLLGTVIVAVCSLGVWAQTPAVRTPSKSEIDLAIGRVERFAPDRFAALPPSTREAFTKMACRVPQRSLTGAPQNMVQGEFAAKGQRDWVGLCSDGTTSEIRVVWGGTAQCEDRFGGRQDSDSMVAASPGVIAFDRIIRVAPPDVVSRYLLRLETSLPEEPTHDAVEDRSAGVGLVHYCTGGHWRMLPGGRG